PQGGVDGAARATVDGLGLYVFLCLYRYGHGRVHLLPERERAFARDRSHLYQRPVQDSAGAGLRWRSAPLPGEGERRGGPVLAVSEAGRQDCYRVRRVRHLRREGVLQERERRDLQELRGP